MIEIILKISLETGSKIFMIDGKIVTEKAFEKVAGEKFNAEEFVVAGVKGVREYFKKKEMK